MNDLERVKAAIDTSFNLVPSFNWAELLLQRDSVQGRRTLERMIEYYDKHDGKADDFGRLFIVTDALRALGRKS